MIEKATKKFNIDLKKSILIGDTESDILAGMNAKVNKCILVKTGHPIIKNSKASLIYNNIYDFAKSLI